jgi:protein-disulfide isomerase
MEQIMNPTKVISRAVVIGLFLLAPAVSLAQDLRGEIEAIVRDYLASHPEEVVGIVKDYMVKHPEMVSQILAEMLRHRATTNAASNATAANSPAAASTSVPAIDHSSAITANSDLLFSSPRQVTLGNPQGDVTLVEFFDYSCGFCKRALPDMLELLKNDPKLKIVLKEFPILGPGSVEAARVAVAVRMQDAGGQRYLAFHQELLGDPGSASKDKALLAARNQGLDMARLEQDMASGEVNATLSENMKLAQLIGATGTPTYVVGKAMVVGAVGVAGLRDRIDATRKNASN